MKQLNSFSTIASWPVPRAQTWMPSGRLWMVRCLGRIIVIIFIWSFHHFATTMASSYIFSSPGDIKASEHRIGHGVFVDMCPSLWAGDQSRSPVISHQRTQKSLWLHKGAHTNAAVELWRQSVLFLILCFYPLLLLLVLNTQNYEYIDIRASVIWEIRWSLLD